MKNLVILSLVFVLGFASTTLLAGNEKKKIQERCPVMGGPVNKNLYVDYAGKRIYMCCKGCTSKLKANPGYYIKKLEEQGITLDKVPVSTEKKVSKPKKSCCPH